MSYVQYGNDPEDNFNVFIFLMLLGVFLIAISLG